MFFTKKKHKTINFFETDINAEFEGKIEEQFMKEPVIDQSYHPLREQNYTIDVPTIIHWTKRQGNNEPIDVDIEPDTPNIQYFSWLELIPIRPCYSHVHEELHSISTNVGGIRSRLFRSLNVKQKKI